MIWASRKSFIRLDHATDQKRDFRLIRLWIFSNALGIGCEWPFRTYESLISDSATRRSLWPLQCQPVALDDEWQISKTLIQSSIQTHGQVSKTSYFDIGIFKIVLLVKAHVRTWSSDPELEPEPPEPVHFARSRSRSRSRWTVLLGAGAGAGAGMLPRSRSRSRTKM